MENIKNIIEQIAIQVNMIGGKMYYVGGYVRDLYCGKNSSDIDVRVMGITKQQLDTILRQFGKTYWIKARYDLVKLIGLDIDFSSPENKDGSLKTIQDLTAGVDFTMNSIFIDVITGEVVDPYNGVEDIKNGIIRISNIDNIDDEFLAVRGARFKVKLGFEFDPRSETVIKGFSFKDVKKQRILLEFRKMINDPEFFHSEFYRVALKLGILDKLLSPLGELNELSVNINGRSINAFEHTMRMLDYLAKYKGMISDFEELYVVALTYHLRSVDSGRIVDGFRTFFENVLATNKMKNEVYFVQDNETLLFNVYNNFQTMSDEELLLIYQRYRKRLEDAGYFVESFNMGLLPDVSEEQLKMSDERLQVWKNKIEELRIQSVKSIKSPAHGQNRNFRRKTRPEDKVPKGFTLDDIGEVTMNITPEQIQTHFDNAGSRREKYERNR